MWVWDDGTELYHHGIKGQKWGVRRFQYEDGSLTPAGRQRYSSEQLRTFKKAVNDYNMAKLTNLKIRNAAHAKADKEYYKEYDKANKTIKSDKQRDKAYSEADKKFDKKLESANKRMEERNKVAKAALEKKYGFSIDEAQKVLNDNPMRVGLASIGSEWIDRLLDGAPNNSSWTEKPSKRSGGNI